MGGGNFSSPNNAHFLGNFSSPGGSYSLSPEYQQLGDNFGVENSTSSYMSSNGQDDRMPYDSSSPAHDGEPTHDGELTNSGGPVCSDDSHSQSLVQPHNAEVVPTLQRSTRHRVPPSYLKDYHFSGKAGVRRMELAVRERPSRIGAQADGRRSAVVAVRHFAFLLDRRSRRNGREPLTCSATAQRKGRGPSPPSATSRRREKQGTSGVVTTAKSLPSDSPFCRHHAKPSRRAPCSQLAGGRGHSRVARERGRRGRRCPNLLRGFAGEKTVVTGRPLSSLP
nr:hypothetical protein Iba_chr01dCG3210 [Ipomoea batatas]